jgi:hypothetical protein
VRQKDVRVECPTQLPFHGACIDWACAPRLDMHGARGSLGVFGAGGTLCLDAVEDRGLNEAGREYTPFSDWVLHARVLLEQSV